MLNTKQIDGLKAKDRQDKVSDAESLYLVVTPHAVKLWRTDYKVKATGKRKTHTFGRYPEIGLAKARLLNSQFRDQIAHGSISKSPLFDEVKQDWYLHHLPKLKNIKHKPQVMYRLDVVEDWLSDIAIYSGQLLLQNIQEAVIKQKFGKNAIWPTLTKKEMFSLDDISIRAGSTSKPNKMRERNQCMQVMSMIQQAIEVITHAKAIGNQELAEVTINLLDVTLIRFDEKLDAKTLLGLTDEQGEVPGMEGEGLPQLNANQPQLQIPQQIVQQQGVQNGY